MKKNVFAWIALAFIILSLGAMFLPDGYVIRLNDIRTTSYPYFSLTPHGYESFFPGLTAFTGVLCAISRFISNLSTNINKKSIILTSVSAGFSLLSLFISELVTLVGILISILMILSIVFQCLLFRKKALDSVRLM